MWITHGEAIILMGHQNFNQLFSNSEFCELQSTVTIPSCYIFFPKTFFICIIFLNLLSAERNLGFGWSRDNTYLEENICGKHCMLYVRKCIVKALHNTI